MSIGNLQGYARTNSRSPIAKGECDRCRFWYPLDRLQRQFQWRGAALADTGFLVCHRCLDVPQEQYRVLILPGDPIPRTNARPSPDVTGYATYGSVAVPTNPGNQGFSQYVLGSPTPDNYPNPMTGYPPIDTSDLGKAATLAQVATVSGIPTPGTITDQSTVIAQQNVSQTLFGATTGRTWLLFYNPAVAPVQLALNGPAVFGMTTNLAIGPGEAFFWSASQGLGVVYQGSPNIIGLAAGMPFWCWEAAQ